MHTDVPANAGRDEAIGVAATNADDNIVDRGSVEEQWREQRSERFSSRAMKDEEDRWSRMLVH